MQAELQRHRKDREVTDAVVVREVLNNGFTEEFLDNLSKPDMTLEDRIILYLVWRALALGTFSLRGNLEDMLRLIKSELVRVKRELGHKLINGLCNGREQ
jgi:hypothetical protein